MSINFENFNLIKNKTRFITKKNIIEHRKKQISSYNRYILKRTSLLTECPNAKTKMFNSRIRFYSKLHKLFRNNFKA